MAYTSRSPGVAPVVRIVACVNVAMVHSSGNMWAAEQQLHPQQVELDPAMLHTKYLCYFTFACLFVLLMRLRLNQERQVARLQVLSRIAEA